MLFLAAPNARQIEPSPTSSSIIRAKQHLQSRGKTPLPEGTPYAAPAYIRNAHEW